MFDFDVVLHTDVVVNFAWSRNCGISGGVSADGPRSNRSVCRTQKARDKRGLGMRRMRGRV
jgi:hypothetical protein